MRECAEEEDCLLAAGVSAPPADCLLVAGVSWPGAGAGAAMLPVLWRLGVRGLLLLCRSISLVTVQLPAPAAHIPAAPQLSRHTAAAGLGHRGRGHGAGGGQVTRVTIVTGHKSQAGSRWSRVTAAGHAAKVGAAWVWPRDHWPRWPRYTGHMGPGLGRWRSNIRRWCWCVYVCNPGTGQTHAPHRYLASGAQVPWRPARTGHWGRNLCLDTHPR